MTPVRCAHCRTELPAHALSCPACGTLVHAERLKRLAIDADLATRAGNLGGAQRHWKDALTLLPTGAEQHAAIRERLAALDRASTDANAASADGRGTTTEGTPVWRRGLPGLATAGVVLASKLKFLLLGLTKASTFISMFAFFGVYWSIYGWPLALGLVLSIYVHEMGHVAMLRTLGIESGAPMFIPGMGAFVMLKQHVTDPLTDAKIGLAGPVWGLCAALVAFGVYEATGARIWMAIAQLTGFLNLFNLIPIWQLDGSRGFHVLARPERWGLVAVIAVALLLTEQRLLLIVGAVAIWRALQQEAGPGDRRVLATFIVLVGALSFLARGVG
jgi:Zn-dependent protease